MPAGVAKGKPGRRGEKVDRLSPAEDVDLLPLLRKEADLTGATRDFARKLQAVLQTDSLSLYRFTELQGTFQFLFSLGKPLPTQREFSSAAYTESEQAAEIISGSETIRRTSTSRLTFAVEKAKSLPLLLIPLRAEGRSLGLVVTSAPQKALDRSSCRLAERISQGLTAALVMEDYRREISGLKQDYHRVEIQKGELTHRLQQKIFDLNSIFQISNRLFALQDERELAESLLEMVRDIMEAHFTGFCGCHPESQDPLSLFCGASFGVSASELPALAVGGPFYSYLWEHREPISLPALHGIKPEEDFLARLLELQFRAMCGVYCGNQLYGIVLCGPKLDGKEYHHGDLAGLSVLCNMASVALQSLRQFRLIEELSYTDSMTGAYNYRYFYKRLTEEATRARRHSRKLSLVIFDLDEFKSYNDRFGHQTGDEILRQLAKHTKEIVRSIDVVCRYGGEEFCVIMPDTDRQKVESFVERLREAISDCTFEIRDLASSPRVTASIGAAVFPEDADTVDRLIYCADMALLEAKKGGRNLAYLFSPQMVATDRQTLQRESQTARSE